MPKTLLRFLTGLTTKRAEELHAWLDGTPDATGGILDAIVEVHGNAMMTSGYLSSPDNNGARKLD